MTGWTTCAAVIPCSNEGSSIAALVCAVRQYLPLVLVVDDGSTDNTASAASQAGAIVISHAHNFGKGVAIRTGLSTARKLGFEWAVTLDGDGQHAPDDLPAFLRCAELTGATLVVGNRMHNARAIPWLRRQVNRWMSRQLSRRAGRHLPDTQCGFRLVHVEFWAGLSLNTEHFEIESEMLMSFLAAKYPVAFIPIRVIGRARGSHIRPVTDSLRWWKWWRGLKQFAARPAAADFPFGGQRRIHALFFRRVGSSRCDDLQPVQGRNETFCSCHTVTNHPLIAPLDAAPVGAARRPYQEQCVNVPGDQPVGYYDLHKQPQ